MAFAILQAVARQTHLFKTPMQAVIFQCLASYCDKSGKAWPSYQTLAKQCNCAYRTVQRAFSYFKKRRYIIYHRRWNTSSIYQITASFFALIRIRSVKATTAITATNLRNRLGIGATSLKTQELAHPAFNRFSSGTKTTTVSPSAAPAAAMPKASGAPSYVRELLQRLKTEIAEEIIKKQKKRFNN